MNEFIEKLIERLEEYEQTHLIERDTELSLHCQKDCGPLCDCTLCVWDKAKDIVKELAEEYESKQREEKIVELGQQFCDKVDEILQKKNNGWIPVSERLPSYDGSFICTAKGIEESLELGYSSWDNSWMDEFDSEYEVIAWMPLPEPFSPSLVQDWKDSMLNKFDGREV